jgi:hypothetical protein
MSKWIQAERDDLKIDEKEQTLDIFVDIENDEGAVYSMVRLDDLREILSAYDSETLYDSQHVLHDWDECAARIDNPENQHRVCGELCHCSCHRSR